MTTYSQTVMETAAQIAKHVVEAGRVGDDRMPAEEWNETLRTEVEFEAEERGYDEKAAAEIANAAVEHFGR